VGKSRLIHWQLADVSDMSVILWQTLPEVQAEAATAIRGLRTLVRNRALNEICPCQDQLLLSRHNQREPKPRKMPPHGGPRRIQSLTKSR
jgi:hypothetical protein